MQTEELLQLIDQLRTKGKEWETVDAKQELVLKENGDKAEFIKDIVAMANNQTPSYLVIGLVDGTFQSVGKLNHHHIQNNINQLLAGKIDPPITVNYSEFSIGEEEYAVVEVHGQNAPYLVAQDVTHNPSDRKRTKVYKGTIFVRHADRTEGASRTELDNLLKKKGFMKHFENETEYTQKLVLEHEDYWEYLLTAELLKTRLEPIRQRFADLDKGLLYKRTIRMKGEEYISWISSRCDDLLSMITAINTVFDEKIPEAWGPPGEPGDALKIKRVADNIAIVSEDLLEWEIEVKFTTPPEAFSRVKELVANWASPIFDQLETISSKLSDIFKVPNPEGEYVIHLVLDGPKNIDEFTKEIRRLETNPQEWLSSYW